MIRIVDYLDVQRRLTAAAFVCLYHNSGAWGFAREVQSHIVGWIGPDDPTIREAALRFARRIPEPHAANLADLFRSAWPAHLPGEAWLSPKSHWHYELHFGNRELLETLLPEFGLDPAALRERNDGSAIAFSPDDAPALRSAIQRLLTSLRGSDFQVTFPDHHTACTVHHHQQLWWQTTDPAVAAGLNRMVD
jgi:hypothetical protein